MGIDIEELLAEVAEEDGEKVVRSRTKYSEVAKENQSILEKGRNAKRVTITLPVELYLRAKRESRVKTKGNLSQLIVASLLQMLQADLENC